MSAGRLPRPGEPPDPAGSPGAAGAAGAGATVVAPAKLTVSLRVTGVRADGYHLLEAEMVSLALADELTFTGGDGLEVVAGSAGGAAPEAGAPEASAPESGGPESGGPEAGAPEAGGPGRGAPGGGGSGDLGPAEDNLVRRALQAVGRTAHVRLVKRIPVGGGLGGGSTDAAAVLRWAGCDDVTVAAALGADVPFCLRGGRARVTGTGEIVEPLPFVARTFTLVTPPFGCSTPAVYRAWDRLGGPRADGPNDLEPAALAVEPRLARWRDELAASTGQVPVLAGSGSTWFVEGAHPGDGRIVTTTVPAYG